jgi:hypothetical protein
MLVTGNTLLSKRRQEIALYSLQFCRERQTLMNNSQVNQFITMIGSGEEKCYNNNTERVFIARTGKIYLKM